MIAKQIQDLCKFLHRSDILLLLQTLEKKKPHYQIQANQFSVRRLEFTHKRSDREIEHSKKSKYAQCLQMKVFDENENKTKCLEVFLSEKVQLGMDLIDHYAKQSMKLARTDLVLNVLDSYYLDDDQIFYVIEYEDFLFQISQNYGDLSRKGYKKHLKNIFEYSQESLFPFSTLKKQIEYCSFSYVQDSNDCLKIKLNTIDPFRFEDGSNVNAKEQTRIHQDIEIESPQEQGLFIKREDFIFSITHMNPNLLKYHNEIINYIFESKGNFNYFNVISCTEYQVSIQAVEKFRSEQLKNSAIKNSVTIIATTTSLDSQLEVESAKDIELLRRLKEHHINNYITLKYQVTLSDKQYEVIERDNLVSKNYISLEKFQLKPFEKIVEIEELREGEEITEQKEIVEQEEISITEVIAETEEQLISLIDLIQKLLNAAEVLIDSQIPLKSILINKKLELVIDEQHFSFLKIQLSQKGEFDFCSPFILFCLAMLSKCRRYTKVSPLDEKYKLFEMFSSKVKDYYSYLEQRDLSDASELLQDITQFLEVLKKLIKMNQPLLRPCFYFAKNTFNEIHFQIGENNFLDIERIGQIAKILEENVEITNLSFCLKKQFRVNSDEKNDHQLNSLLISLRFLTNMYHQNPDSFNDDIISFDTTSDDFQAKCCDDYVSFPGTEMIEKALTQKCSLSYEDQSQIKKDYFKYKKQMKEDLNQEFSCSRQEHFKLVKYLASKVQNLKSWEFYMYDCDCYYWGFFHFQNKPYLHELSLRLENNFFPTFFRRIKEEIEEEKNHINTLKLHFDEDQYFNYNEDLEISIQRYNIFKKLPRLVSLQLYFQYDF